MVERRSRIALALIVCMSMIAGAFVLGGEDVAAQSPPRVLTVGIPQDIPDFNTWNLASNSVWKSNVINWGFEGLVMLDYDTIPGPALAESWTFDEPSLTWTFHMRQNVKFHDGSYLTADDVVFIYQHAREGTTYMWDIINAFDADNDGVASEAEMTAAVTKVDTYTVTMKMGSPYGQFLTRTATVPILPKAIWQNHLTFDGLLDVLWNDPGATVGTGPFSYLEGVDGSYRVIEAFTDYWGRNSTTPLGYNLYPANIDRVYFKVYPGIDAAIVGLQSGEADYLPWAMTPGRIPSLQADPNIKLVYEPDNGYFYLAFNQKFDPMGSLPFRQAVSHVIDKDHIVDVFMGGLGVKGDATEPPFWGKDAWYNNTVEKYAFDSDFSTPNALLDGAGFYDVNADGWRELPDGSPMQKITILTPPADYDPVRVNAGVMIAENMRYGLHINAEAKAIDFDTLVTRLQSMAYQMLIIGWSLSSDPVGNVFDIIGPRASSNTFGFWSLANPNPYYKDLFGVVTRADAESQALADECLYLEDKAKSSFNVSDQIKYTRWAEGVIAEAVPVNVLYYRVNVEAHSSSWVGWHSSMGLLLNRFSLGHVMDVGVTGFREANAGLNVALSLPDKVGIAHPISAYLKAIDSSGKPVQGASVSVAVSGYGSGPVTVNAAPSSGITNATGIMAFDLTGTSRGYSNVSISVNKGGNVAVDAGTVESVGSSEPTLVLGIATDARVLRPRESTVIYLNVTDELGAPVQGATISVDTNLICYGAVDNTMVVTDSAGEATMTYMAPFDISQFTNSHLNVLLVYTATKPGYVWAGSGMLDIAIFNDAPPDWVVVQVDSVGTTALDASVNTTMITVSTVDEQGNPLPRQWLYITYSDPSLVYDPADQILTDDFGIGSFDVQMKSSSASSALRVTIMNRTVLNAVPVTITLTFAGSGPVPRMYGGYMSWDTHYLDPQVDWIEATAYIWDETGAPADGINASLVVSGTPYGSLVWNDYIQWDSTYDGWGINIVTAEDNANLVTSGPFTTYYDYADWDFWYNVAGYIYWYYPDNVMVPVDVVGGSVTVGIYAQDWAPVDLLSQVFLVPEGVGTFNGTTLAYELHGPTTISGDYAIGRAYSFAEPYLYISDPVLEARNASYDSTSATVIVYDENNAPLPYSLTGVYENSLRGSTDFTVTPSTWVMQDEIGGSGRVIVAQPRSGPATSASIQVNVYAKAVNYYSVSMITQTCLYIQVQQCFVMLDPIAATATVGDVVPVTATVLDFSGAPVEGLTVELVAEAGEIPSPSAVSDVNGKSTFVIYTANITSSPVGFIPVTATARGPAYDFASARMLIPIREGQPPNASAGTDETVTEGDIVTFSGLGSTDNFAVVNYTWNFTYDGSPVLLYGATPSFQFLIPGTYNVTLTVTDQAGNSDTDVVVITVEVLIPEFPSLVLPVCGFLAAALVIARRRIATV